MLAPKLWKKERRCIQLTLHFLGFMLKEAHGKQGSRNDPAFICCEVLIFGGGGGPSTETRTSGPVSQDSLSLSAAGGGGGRENKSSPRATHSPERARVADGHEVYCTRTPAPRFDLAKSNSPDSLPRPVRIRRQFSREERN